MKNKKGKFIVLEGLDGSGKSIQAKLAFDYLKKKGIKAILTKEPTDKPPLGNLIREVLRKKMKLTSPASFQLLYSADRAEHLERVIAPALEKGFWVISDRYYYSTIAYGSLNLDRKWLYALNESFLVPDKTFIFKVGPQICLERIRDDGRQKEFFEKVAKLKKAWSGYVWCAKKFKEIQMINGERAIEKIAQDVAREIDKLL